MTILNEQQIRNLISRILIEGFKDDQNFLKEKYPRLSQKLSDLNPKQIRWLIMRFGEKPQIKEAHPIEDCIPTLISYARQEQGIKTKYNENAEFKKTVDEEFPQNKRKWANPAETDYITIDEMEQLKILAARKKQNVKLENNIDVSSTIIGKVGPWTIYMPNTVEESCNIVGLDPQTQKPNTTWCTARFEGENLFYAYMVNGAILFYIIKDNPKGPNDYISLGYLNGKLKADGSYGGVTVNGTNNGLTQEHLSNIFGQYYKQIMSITNEKVKPLGGKHPSTKLLKSAFYDMDSFNKLFAGLSRNNRLALLRTILGSDDDDTVQNQENLEHVRKMTPEIAQKMSEILLDPILQGKLGELAGINIVPNMLITSLCHKTISLHKDGDTKNAVKLLKFLLDWWNEYIKEQHLSIIVKSHIHELLTILITSGINIPRNMINHVMSIEKVENDMHLLRDMIFQIPEHDFVLDILKKFDKHDRQGGEKSDTGKSWLVTGIQEIIGYESVLQDGLNDELAQLVIKYAQSNDNSQGSHGTVRWLMRNMIVSDMSKLSTKNIDIILKMIEHLRHNDSEYPGLNNNIDDTLFTDLSNPLTETSVKKYILQHKEFIKNTIDLIDPDNIDHIETILRGLCQQTALTSEILDMICDVIDTALHKTKHYNAYIKSTYIDCIKMLLKSKSNVERIKPQYIDFWLSYSSKALRFACATCEYLRTEHYLKLAHDDDAIIRQNLALNPGVSDDVLHHLASNDTIPDIRHLASRQLHDRQPVAESNPISEQYLRRIIQKCLVSHI